MKFFRTTVILLLVSGYATLGIAADAMRVEIRRLDGCVEPITKDPSFLLKRISPPGTGCKGAASPHAMIDTFIGVEWAIGKNPSKEKIIDVGTNPFASDEYVACIEPIPPQGDVMRVWAVESKGECDYGERPIVYRIFHSGLACLVTATKTKSCMKVELLRPKAQARVHELISEMKERVRG